MIYLYISEIENFICNERKNYDAMRRCERNSESAEQYE